ncbi:MAG: hypothetical protein VYA55_09715 [Pseudomonadota bacterium]|nr:hypothetical protein [Pseudomonadota bacterium]
MGGTGSGRGLAWNKRTTLEEILKIDIRHLKKRGILRPSLYGSLHWHCGGQASGNINYRTHRNGIELIYRYRPAGGDWQDIRQPIQYEDTPCHFGGTRKWFVCPGCGQRVGVLGCHEGLFLCRHCNRLPYASQSEAEIDRMIRARNKLGKRIFAGDGEREYCRRKGMHRTTYERLLTRYCELDWVIDHWISVRLEALEGLERGV